MLKSKAMMKKSVLLALVLMCTALLLSGCLGPKTPQEVAKAFWYSVINHDAQNVVKYSTLNNPQEFDGFGLDWHGFTPAWGRIVIDGDQASIVTEFSGPTTNAADKRKCVTYLIRSNDVWKVDYKMTGNDLHGGALGALFGQLNRLGNELSMSLDASVNELNAEMERLSRRLKEVTDSFSQQATKIIDKYADDLQQITRQLADSINRALNDKNNHPSEKDRQTMTEVAADLDTSSRALANPSTQTVTASNKQMATAQQRLDTINSGVADDYKTQWQTLGRQFATVMRNMLDELAASVKRNNTQ
jgi:uncharacterized membrane-anchored protein YhcB (DUF1043 family)